MSATDPKSEGEAAELNPEDKPEPTVAVPRPEAKVAGPKPDAKAVELTKSDSKAADSTPKAPATDPKPDAKAAEPAKPGTVVNKAKPEIRNKLIIAASIMGVLAALIAAYLFGVERKAQPPAFAPVSSPYDSAIYANGIIESDQPNGSNVYIYPEVPGPITHVLVHEGQNVPAGTPLFSIDDSVQRPATQQLLFQSEAALALLNELKAEPRPETLAVVKSQVGQAEAPGPPAR